jgi:hypothetical protein
VFTVIFDFHRGACQHHLPVRKFIPLSVTPLPLLTSLPRTYLLNGLNPITMTIYICLYHCKDVRCVWVMELHLMFGAQVDRKCIKQIVRDVIGIGEVFW